MKKEFDTLRASRKLMLKSIEHLSDEQLNTIPNNFKNNIIWNVAHLVVTQQLLWYSLSNTEPLISKEMIEKYRKGTAPTETINSEEIQIIKDFVKPLLENSIADFERGIFNSYNAYNTSFDVSLNSINDAIKFNNFHEGLHLGIIMALRKLV